MTTEKNRFEFNIVDNRLTIDAQDVEYENKQKLKNWLYNYFANNKELQCDLFANAGIRFVDNQTNTTYFLTNQDMTPLLDGGLVTINCQ